jgi:two-component system, chemotaxis family, CheB/CheR fusion protein
VTNETKTTPADSAGAIEAASTRMTVVGIGASAGGLKALQQFVEAVPADSGMAYVVIVHLDPVRESRLDELLGDRARIPVLQVTGPTAVEGDHIYIIPPGHDLTIRGTTLGLQPRAERSQHAPVDLFFRTLAAAYGPEAVGVVLSGTGADGTDGIRHIREAGGVTIAQLPDEAEYDGMPSSAISTGLVDLVLRSSRIPSALVRLRQFPSPFAEAVEPTRDQEKLLAAIFATLRNRTGHDFSQYKRSTVLRRLDRRLRFNGAATLQEYLPLLQSSGTECHALLRDLLISVSSFFRDPDAFDGLAALAPMLFEGKGPADTVRVWVVGCATGEEVYSIAMVLSDHAATLPDPPRLQLFATDIDEQGYSWARAGQYASSSVANVSPERLQRYFRKENGGYRVANPLRELVLFAGHNVLHDPPFARLDLISCRNLFIYLQPTAQEAVLETFHFALNVKGLLFLGAAESVGDSGLFTAIGGGTHRLYRRRASQRRILPRLAAADLQPGRGQQAGATSSDPATAPADSSPTANGALRIRMLEQYVPASVVVDQRLDIVHSSAAAGGYLRLGEGEPTHNVLAMVSKELRTTLRTALHHAFADGRSSTRRVSHLIDGITRSVSVHVRPSAEAEGEQRFALIVFAEDDGAVAPLGARPDGRAAVAAPADAGLAEELRRTREMLESISTAHDRTVAELQTVNEELQSINEEQRAAAQELETGREEIEAINEELTAINQEHQGTIEELKRTNADLENLIESTEIGTIFIDRGMRIRRFTPAIAALFNFVAEDQGRPLAHITHRLSYPDLMDDVASVLAVQQRVEREVSSENGEWYVVRISPYRSFDGTNEGAVLTFVDNTAQHRAAEELRAAKLKAEAADLAKGTFLSTLSHEFRTPLNAILGYADLLHLDGALNTAQEQKVDRIRTGGWHMVSMINEILSFAKLDAGHELVQPEPVDARMLATEAAALMEPAAAAKGLGFILDLPETPIPLETDPGKARQILINLCSNAIKYTNEGEVRLRAGAERSRVTFDVSDTGIGIAPEHLNRVFERFWQVDGAATRAAGGMGIGLAAAREYARLLRGDVEVESELGRGTTFCLWLPVAYDRR